MGLVFTNEEFGALLAELIKAAGIEGNVHIDLPRHRTDPGCVICGEHPCRPTGLVGGYETTLCQADNNAWHQHIIEDPTFLRMDVLRTEYLIAIGKGERHEALNAQEQRRKVGKELFDIGKDWVRTMKAIHGPYPHEDNHA